MKESPIQESAPDFRINFSNKKLIGTVNPKTNITAKPIPTDVFTVLDTAK